MPARRPLAVRFWEKVDTSDADGCWLWTASVAGRYGSIASGRGLEVIRAHRASWEIAHGAVPSGLRVLHKCDVTLCVRPDHLFLGTQADNVADMYRKGRQRILAGDEHPARRPGARDGTRNGRHRLTEDDVRQIRQLRADGVIFREIAARFGVAVPTVQHVCSRKNWSKV